MTRSPLSTYRRSGSESDLLDTIIEAARLLGWRAHHDRRSDLALQQGDPGFPDLVLVRRGRIFFIETKREGENLTEAQWAWFREFAPNSHAVTALTIRPSDLDALLVSLR